MVGDAADDESMLRVVATTRSDDFVLADTRIGRPLSIAGPSAVAAKDSRRIGSKITPTVGAPVYRERNRYAEDGNPIRIVHGAVERVDDPNATAFRGRHISDHGAIVTALFGDDFRPPGNVSEIAERISASDR